ncbi:hypothetical protein [Syntrophotalea carbinolica]|uniref:hypothetical protein n=1 Tax=Syntrophotalea carbinolica TaxID=19 RepID=UPI00130DF922|nr:hypothetical protein [Syntrophotalea carbinolica]
MVTVGFVEQVVNPHRDIVQIPPGGKPVAAAQVDDRPAGSVDLIRRYVVLFDVP